MNEIDSLMDQLNTIEGLDLIPTWPLAIGWWIVIGIGIALLALSSWYLIKWLAFRRSWKYDTLEKLNHLQYNLSEETIQNTAVLLSEYMRRIALRRFSRKTCAGLTGQAWLEWLANHDPKKFDWINHGKILINAPYAPATHSLSTEQLKTLIYAAKEWVH